MQREAIVAATEKSLQVFVFVFFSSFEPLALISHINRHALLR
jgi:hypothetical protein